MYTSNTLYRRRQITNNPLAAIPTGIIAGLGVCPISVRVGVRVGVCVGVGVGVGVGIFAG